MLKQLIHPEMLPNLLDMFYTSEVTIKYYTAENPDAYGQPQPTWVNLVGHVDLPCAIAPSGGGELKRPDMTVQTSSHIISIAGYYPSITPKMRAIIGSGIYDILLLEVDSHSKMTRLTCQVVN